MYADHTPRLPRHWSDPEVFETTQASVDLSADSDRLLHLVLVDGRLAEAWSEPVGGSRWQHHAERFDRERRPPPTASSPTPTWLPDGASTWPPSSTCPTGPIPMPDLLLVGRSDLLISTVKRRLVRARPGPPGGGGRRQHR